MLTHVYKVVTHGDVVARALLAVSRAGERALALVKRGWAKTSPRTLDLQGIGTLCPNRGCSR